MDDLELSELATEEHLLNTGTEREENGDIQNHSKCLRFIFRIPVFLSF